jgi:hypothetical protein
MNQEEKKQQESFVLAEYNRIGEKYPNAHELILALYRLGVPMGPVQCFAVLGYKLEMNDEDLPTSLYNLEVAFSWVEERYKKFKEGNYEP